MVKTKIDYIHIRKGVGGPTACWFEYPSIITSNDDFLVDCPDCRENRAPRTPRLADPTPKPSISIETDARGLYRSVCECGWRAPSSYADKEKARTSPITMMHWLNH